MTGATSLEVEVVVWWVSGALDWWNQPGANAMFASWNRTRQESENMSLSPRQGHAEVAETGNYSRAWLEKQWA
jgi:hypothetical protein